MGGPGASIILREKLDSLRVERVLEVLGHLGARRTGTEFTIDERPFVVWFGEEYLGELREREEGGLPELLGWRPADSVGFAAMCNEQVDHQLVAEICAEVAERLGGIIDFGGPIGLGPVFPKEAPHRPMKIVNPGGVPGLLYATCYEIHPGRYGTCHFGDAALLRSYLQLPSFRMVK
jgi:hypothetical protein